MKKITWILTCVLVVALLAGCDVGVVDGPGMVNKNVAENPDVTNDISEARVQSEQAFVEPLLICFMATAIMQRLQHDLYKSSFKESKSTECGKHCHI